MRYPGVISGINVAGSIVGSVPLTSASFKRVRP